MRPLITAEEKKARKEERIREAEEREQLYPGVHISEDKGPGATLQIILEAGDSCGCIMVRVRGNPFMAQAHFQGWSSGYVYLDLSDLVRLTAALAARLKPQIEILNQRIDVINSVKAVDVK